MGNIGDVDRMLQICETYGLNMVEDSTEALGSRQNGNHAGTWGMLGTLSFNGNKIITTGGGGMILTQDEKLAKWAKHLTTTAKRVGEEYFHDEVGHNYRLVNILAALGVAQMEQLPGFLNRRREIADYYRQELGGMLDFRCQEIRPDTEVNEWIFTLMTDSRDRIAKELKAQGIQTRSLWVPMNQLPMYKDVPYITKEDVSNQLYKQSISLPSSSSLTEEDCSRICSIIQQTFASEPS